MIKVKVNKMDSESDPGCQILNKIIGYTVYVEGASIELFKQLIHRGLNCWEDAPADLKELGDMFTHGRVTQNHHKQTINSKRESNPELGTDEEMARIDAFVCKYGIDKWRELILSGESHLVIAGTWKEKPILLGIDPAKPGADQTVETIVETKSNA